MKLNIIILAAGQGKRMHSAMPKILHDLAGTPILERVVDAATQLNPNQIYVVHGHGGAEVRERLSHLNVTWVEQKEQLGTAHAVQQALPLLDDDSLTLVLLGDVPLISVSTLQALLDDTAKNAVGLLVADFSDPHGLGRIVRNKAGDIKAIVEDKDATEEQRQITEIFTGIMLSPTKPLKQWMSAVNNENAQGEYYLTAIPSIAISEGCLVTRVVAACPEEVLGVNDRKQLTSLERYYQRWQADQLMLSGVTLRDPTRLDIRGELQTGKDIIIDVNVVMEGKISLGNNVVIGPNVVLRDVTIGDNVTIKAHSALEGAIIENDCVVGPFARLRPGTHLSSGVKVGNFVEIKKSQIGQASKVSHLSYIGDAEIGTDVNIGAGTITCNYDGYSKYQTTIGDHAFIGSGTQLVAPVTVGAAATIGAGTTLRESAEAGHLTFTCKEQKTLTDWERPHKETD